MDPVRKLILDKVEGSEHSLASLSKAIPRNQTYLQQFITKGSPKKLPEDVRKALAALLKVEEAQLGGMPDRSRRSAANAAPYERSRQNVAGSSHFIRVPEHDVRASAGPGTIVEDETEVAEWTLPSDYVRRTLALRGNSLAMIEVVGDSMEPTLETGDKILIDLGDRNIAMPGVFALFDGDATVVKRVEKVPGTEEIQLISDNPLHSNYRVPAQTVNVAGRVVWFGRRL